MKLITRNTDYAVRALCFMAKNAGVITASEMVSKLKIPRPFLRKLLQILNREKILVSAKGNKGGFFLSLPPDKIHLADIVKVFQGDLKINQCLFKKKVCPNRKSCVLRKHIADIENYAVKKIKSVSIADLL